MRTLLLMTIGIAVSACGVGYGSCGYGAPASDAPAPSSGTLTVKNYVDAFVGAKY